MPFAGWMPFLSARTRSRYALRSKPARPQRFMTTARVEATGRTGPVVGLIGRRVFCLACPLLAEEDASRGGHGRFRECRRYPGRARPEGKRCAARSTITLCALKEHF